MTDDELKVQLKKEGFKEIRYVKGKGWCGIKGFMFTVGLCCGLDKLGWDHRYCYPPEQVMVPILQLLVWSKSEDEVTEDPQDPFWIKRKGTDGEWGNHLHGNFDERFDKKNPELT